MPNKFDKLAAEAKTMTDEQFKGRFSSLTTLSDTDISKIINDTGISKQNLADLLVAIKDATDFNNQTAKSVMNIQNGVQALMAITKRLLI